MVVLGALGPPEETVTRFKVATGFAGIHRVDYAHLRQAGLPDGTWHSHDIGLSHRGTAVPIWVEDGGDGVFGEGDWIEFRAEILPGALGYYHEYSPHNIYVLDMTAAHPLRMAAGYLREFGTTAEDQAKSTSWRGTLRREVDTLLMRFEARENRPHEIWYWKKLACTDKEPFTDTFFVDSIDLSSTGTVDFHVFVRGWSTIPDGRVGQLDHALMIWINGRLIKTEFWDGKEPHVLTLKNLPVALFRAGENTVAFQIRKRNHVETDRMVIDVCVLNAYQLSFPQSDFVPQEGQVRFLPDDGQSESDQWIVRSQLDELRIYTDGGMRYEAHRVSPSEDPHGFIWRIPVSRDETGITVVSGAHMIPPARIEPYRPGNLRDADQQADYIMIAHPTLIQAIKPLAAFHRKRGLTVRIVDVSQIYDAFNHGIFHPKAIRRFLEYVQHEWRAPAPRFVLLVGDASWDTKNPSVQDHMYPAQTHLLGQTTHISIVESVPYRQTAHNDRNLVPTWDYFSRSGHAASDNAFVCVRGDDFKPDMAIGRFPVVRPEEVTAIVNKTIDYIQTEKIGPWRTNILWITNGRNWAQQRVDRLSAEMAESGFSATKILPDSKNKSNEGDTERIKEALNRGQYLAYFYGHGGRYIWRTGPPDPLKNHDLFTLEDLNHLQPNPRLPILLSFTCYSAPFDHPSADSIGERFLRLPDKGAVAVLAASWRNNPTEHMNRAVLNRMTEKGTVGEAVMWAKHKFRSRDSIETYNLLGDPAIPLDPPPANVTMRLKRRKSGDARLVGRIDLTRFSGSVRVEALSARGKTLWTKSTQARNRRFHMDLSNVHDKLDRVTRLTCYIWNEERGLDGVGVLVLPSSVEKTSHPDRVDDAQP